MTNQGFIDYYSDWYHVTERLNEYEILIIHSRHSLSFQSICHLCN